MLITSSSTQTKKGGNQLGRLYNGFCTNYDMDHDEHFGLFCIYAMPSGHYFAKQRKSPTPSMTGWTFLIDLLV